MPVNELGLYESDEDVDQYYRNAVEYWHTVGVHLNEHRPGEAHEAGLETLSYITAWQVGSEEKSYLQKHPLTLPTVGQYYCMNAHVALVKEVRLPGVSASGNYQKRQDSYIAVAYIQVDGKKIKTYRSWGFESYSKMQSKGLVGPVADVLEREESAETRLEVMKLLPFVPVKEGEYLSKSLLRKLAKQVARTIEKGRR